VSTGIAIVVYTLAVMWLSGDNVDIDAKGQAVVINGCKEKQLEKKNSLQLELSR